METRCKIKYGEGWHTDWNLTEDSYDPETDTVEVIRFNLDELGTVISTEVKRLFSDRVQYRTDSDSPWISCDPEQADDEAGLTEEELIERAKERAKAIDIVELADILCRVCGEIVPRSGRRGRPRMVHEECASKRLEV